MTCTLSVSGWRIQSSTSLLRVVCVAFLSLGLGVASWAAPAPKNKSLHIYFVDVEGGQATLFVPPAGQSLLITHFHDDHVGGAPQLAARIPVGTFIDHGENRETTDAVTVKDWQAYQALLATGKYKRISLKPGDAVPVKGMEATIISSDGALIEKPLAGAGHDNPYCKDAEHFPADTT